MNDFKKFHVEGKGKNKTVARKSFWVERTREGRGGHRSLCMFAGREAVEGREGQSQREGDKWGKVLAEA